MRCVCLLITGLQPYSWYDMYVQPFHRDVNGAPSIVVRQRTREDGILTLSKYYFCDNLMSHLVALVLSDQRRDCFKRIIMPPNSVGRHYEMIGGVCLFVRPSVCLSVCCVPRPNSKTKRPG